MKTDNEPISSPVQNRWNALGVSDDRKASGECAGEELHFRGQRIPLVPEMLIAGIEAAVALRARISNVRLGLYPTTGGAEPITFDFDGVPHVGVLRGRNRDLVVGCNPEADRAIALRVMIDGDATRADFRTHPRHIELSSKVERGEPLTNNERAERQGLIFNHGGKPSGFYVI